MSDSKRVILITGTSSGFGREAVKQYAAAGYEVVATMRNTAKADPAFVGNPNVEVMTLDVTEPANIEAVLTQVVAEHGHIDALYNNAGYNEAGAFEEVSDASARREMETNFWGPVNMMRAILPIMRQQKHGHILNTSSMAAYLNLPTMAFYSASKAAVSSLSATLSKEVQGFGIQVTNIEPGGFNTRFGVNSKQPKDQMAIYRPVYAANANFAARVFIEAGLGDLKRAVALIVKETLKPNAPLHLVVGMQGYRDARAYLERMITDYDRNASLTATTDPDPEDVNIFKYIYERALPQAKGDMKSLLVGIVLKFQTDGDIDQDDMARVLRLVQPTALPKVQAKLATAVKEYSQRG